MAPRTDESEPAPRFARAKSISWKIVKTAALPLTFGLAWAAWSNWEVTPIDWRKAFSSFGSAFFFVAYFANFIARALNQQDDEDRHSRIIADLDEIKSAFPNFRAGQLVSGTVAASLAPATSNGDGLVSPAPCSTQADLVHESQRALDAGLVRSSLMTLGTALEIAAARAAERVEGSNDRYLGLSRSIVALGGRLTPEHRIALNRLRAIRNQLSHEARFDFTPEQVGELHEAFRRAISLLDAIERGAPQ
ncbi:MAG: hypothetical protein JNM69_16240 [Archangium sp.]|nr:hypothetical protein [Archangium sp.]